MLAVLARWHLSKRLGACCLALALLWGQGLSAKTITVAAAEWPPMTYSNGSGIYFQVLSEALATQEIRLNIRVANWKRSKQMFYANRADVLLADYHSGGPRQFYPRWHLDVDRPVVLFSRQPLAELNQLQGKAVGWLLGYDFDQLLPVKVDGIEVQTEQQGFELLMHQRLDAYISYEEQVPAAMRHQLARRQLSSAKALYPLFQNNFAGRQLAEQFDLGMQRLYDSGRLQQIYQQYFDRAAFPPEPD